MVTSLERGGPPEQSIVLATHLARAGVDVTAVCATDELADRFASGGAEPLVVPLRHALDVRRAELIRRRVAGFDVIHAQDRRSGLWMHLWPRPRGLVKVYTVRGLPDAYLPPPAGSGRPTLRDRLAYEWLEPALCRRADAVVVASRAVAAILRDRLNFPADRLTVVPNGVEIPPARTAGGELVAALGVLEPVKGLDVFVRAAALLAARGTAPPFAVFGTGSQHAELERLAAELGLDGRMRFPGHVPSPEALEKTAVLVMPSHMENCPNALLEAMAAGVPIVASRVGGVPELVDDACAQLVPPGDPVALAAAIERMLGDPGLASRQAQAARTRVEAHFTAERNAQAVLALYTRLGARGSAA